MSVLTKKAGELRALAQELDTIAADAPRSAADLLRRFGPQVYKYQQRLELTHANDSDFVRHVIKRAGVELGVKIGEKLQADYKGTTRVDPFETLSCYSTFGRDIALYEAELFVMSRSEITELLQKAYRAGRESL